MSSSRKRVISSCIPCYTRKQKCNREYPCNHCTRRQCIQECVYYSTVTTNGQTLTPPGLPENRRVERPSDMTVEAVARPTPPPTSRDEWNAYAKSVTPGSPRSSGSLAESFGYSEGSESNTLALIQKLGLVRQETSRQNVSRLDSQAIGKVHQIMERIPEKQIIDFLVQYFVSEVNWIDQIVHAPWFLSRYRGWRPTEQILLVAEVDFVILVLRICSYASQFLPSPAYTLDKIRGILLGDVRNICDEISDNLEAISTAVDARGSLHRIQHMAFYGLKCQIEGRVDASWETLGRAIRNMQKLGMVCETTAATTNEMDKIEREMERRTFCNLYIWDSVLSRQLDRIPFISGTLRPGLWPQLHLLRGEAGGGGEGADPGIDAPDPYTERVLQAHMAEFWRVFGPAQGTEYDTIAAEERYDKFCSEFLSQLPPAFAIDSPNETWDKRFPKLALQRKLLHIAIYDSICWNFRPLLLRQCSTLPAYKSVMLGWQKKKLAAAALHTLKEITQLHSLLGGCHTRHVIIVFSTFEAAVLLVYLCTDSTFPEKCPEQHIPPPAALKADPIQTNSHKITLIGCLTAVKEALKRLEMLAEVSSMAELGASTLVQLLNKASNINTRSDTNAEEIHLTQAQDGWSSSDTNSQLEGVNEMTTWRTNDLADLRPVNGSMSIGETMGLADITSWPSFDASNMFSQDMEYWALERTDTS